MVARGQSAGGVALPPDRLLVIDESLDKRLASQLEQRGRKAKSTDWLGLVGFKDEPLLRALAQLPENDALILVTGDDAMPGEHSGLLAALGLTVATVDGRRLPDWGPEEWKKEIVHRWAHVMNEQQAGTMRRYGLMRHGPWRPRR
jgi:hypothetical protein